jgi:hypothetical protein
MRAYTYIWGLGCLLWAQNVGIGTSTPTHTLHVSGGQVRVEGLSGTGNALVGLDENGVTYRINFTGSASDFLRGDGTWGPDPGDWKLLGNAGTNPDYPNYNYLGTADAKQFHIRTNNTERMRFLVDGPILIGTTTTFPTPAVLQVQGGNANRAIYGYKASSSGTSVVLGIATTGGANRAGVVGQATSSTGVGLVGMVGVSMFVHYYLGPGIAGTGQDYGIAAYAENTSGDRAAGRFEAPINNTSTIRSLVSAFVSGTQYKIYGLIEGGSGTLSTSTVIADAQGRLYAMACPEAPEILFMDRGTAQLIRGEVYVALDPALSFNLYVDEKYPLLVFVQPMGPCKGTLYVTDRSRHGFRIRSTDPTETIPVSYWIVAHRNDTYSPNGLRLSRHVGVRLPEVPEDLLK